MTPLHMVLSLGLLSVAGWVAADLLKARHFAWALLVVFASILLVAGSLPRAAA